MGVIDVFRLPGSLHENQFIDYVLSFGKFLDSNMFQNIIKNIRGKRRNKNVRRGLQSDEKSTENKKRKSIGKHKDVIKKAKGGKEKKKNRNLEVNEEMKVEKSPKQKKKISESKENNIDVNDNKKKRKDENDKNYSHLSDEMKDEEIPKKDTDKSYTRTNKDMTEQRIQAKDNTEKSNLKMFDDMNEKKSVEDIEKLKNSDDQKIVTRDIIPFQEDSNSTQNSDDAQWNLGELIDKIDKQSIQEFDLLPKIDGVVKYDEPRMFNQKTIYLFRFGTMLFATEKENEAKDALQNMNLHFLKPQGANLRCPTCQLPFESKVVFTYHFLHGCKPIPTDHNEFFMLNMPIAFFLFPSVIAMLKVMARKDGTKIDIFNPMASPYNYKHSFTNATQEMNFERSLLRSKKTNKGYFNSILQIKQRWVNIGTNTKGEPNRPKHLCDSLIVPEILHMPFLHSITKLLPLFETTLVLHNKQT